MANNKKQQLTIWGRANSVNVQKVLWCLAELDLAYERIDAGMQFGKNNEAAYLAMNPNGRVPTLVDGDYVLWESNSVMRYLCMAYGDEFADLSAQPKARAGVDRWLDWTLSTLQPVDRPVFWALVRTPVEKRDMVAIQKDVDAEAVVWRIVEAQLASRRFIEGDQFTIADIALGAYARRWFGRRGRHQAETAEPRTLVCAVRRPPRFCAVHRAADDVSSARSAGRAGADAHRAADFHAGVGAFDLDEASAVFRAGIGRIRALQRQQLAGCRGLVGLLGTGLLGERGNRRQHHSHHDQEGFSHPAFYRPSPIRARLADELDADRFAATPDHFAAASGPGVARKRQPQFRRQRVGIVDRDLGAGRGQILHHALARGKAALERDPPGLAQRFARLALLAR